MDRLSADGIALDVNPIGGLIEGLTITAFGATLEPLHRAPWTDSPSDVPAGAPPHLLRLAGDFFCAPFGRPDIEPAPTHGWAANGLWSLQDRRREGDAYTTTFRLDHTILDAVLTKTIALRDGHPVVYQCHTFSGGAGAVPIAHHAMIRVPGGARLSFSPKDFGATPEAALEPDPTRGRSILAYPQRFPALGTVRLADGRSVDARTYPFADGHEDFLTLFDPPNAVLGWSAALAKADGFLFFALKDARTLPQTSLWMSNGGRSYAPWSSRHTAVLGIEEACSHFGDGHRRSISANSLSEAGYRTALPLRAEATTAVRYAFGAIPADPNWISVVDVALQRGRVIITDESGATATVPFDDDFFGDAA